MIINYCYNRDLRDIFLKKFLTKELYLCIILLEVENRFQLNKEVNYFFIIVLG